jgi:GTPase SAR1 family protein
MDQLNHWITFILFKMYNIPFVIVGCKYDLRNFNSIYVEKMELYAKDKGAKAYIECSSKINYNIEELVTFTRKNNEKSQKSFCNFI